jgi:glutamyl-tRNA synthetase
VENKKIPKIQWVSDEVPCRVLMPDGKWVLGMAESGIKRLKKGQIIQFERFGFVRFDTKAKDAYEFWFAHR